MQTRPIFSKPHLPHDTKRARESAREREEGREGEREGGREGQLEKLRTQSIHVYVMEFEQRLILPLARDHHNYYSFFIHTL